MEREILNEMHERLVKSFLDMIVLAKLRRRDSPMSGYDVVTLIHKKFRMLVSSGTVYSLLYSMERDGLIRGRWSQRKRVYTLTERGEKKIKAILEAKEKILGIMVNLFI
ncbi:MAG: PadR family transcriptional regulator [Candidatus Bathyarchaeia archaeon]